MFIEEMSKSMIDNRMKTRITENYFPDAASSRITIENYCDFFSQNLKHIHPPKSVNKKTLHLPQGDERQTTSRGSTPVKSAGQTSLNKITAYTGLTLLSFGSPTPKRTFSNLYP